MAVLNEVQGCLFIWKLVKKIEIETLKNLKFEILGIKNLETLGIIE